MKHAREASIDASTFSLRNPVVRKAIGPSSALDGYPRAPLVPMEWLVLRKSLVRARNLPGPTTYHAQIGRSVPKGQSGHYACIGE